MTRVRDKSGDYPVGFKKPPRSTQFKKGESGNPRGRPRGTRNLKTDLREELDERVIVHDPKGDRHISKQRALIMSLLAKAIKGDSRAATTLLNMTMRLLEGDTVERSEPPLTPDEEALLERLELRFQRYKSPERHVRKIERRLPKPRSPAEG